MTIIFNVFDLFDNGGYILKLVLKFIWFYESKGYERCCAWNQVSWLLRGDFDFEDFQSTWGFRINVKPKL